MKYHHTPTTMDKSKKANNAKCWQGLGATRALLHGWWECKILQLLCQAGSFFIFFKYLFIYLVALGSCGSRAP